jgi:hypothetical protein
MNVGPDRLGLGTMLVELAGVAARNGDAVDLLMLLSERATEVLPVDACGVLVIDRSGLLRTVGASAARADVLEALGGIDAVGRECIAAGRAISKEVGDTTIRRSGPGSAFVHAFPLMSHEVAFGTLGVVGSAPLAHEEREVAQALADIGALALLRSDAVEDALTIARRIHQAVQSRATLAQAIGVLAERLTIDPDDAFARLRAMAARGGTSLLRVAAEVLDGKVARPGTGLAAEDPGGPKRP